MEWCRTHGEEPTCCPVPVILRFLQSRFDEGLAAATIRVYAAAISARHNKVDGVTVDSHTLVTRFLKGTQQLSPPQWSQTPSWDLSLVLEVLCQHPFEPLENIEDTWVSLKTAFLLAMASAKRVGELHALSISRECLQWAREKQGSHCGLTHRFYRRLSPRPAFDPPTGEDEQWGNSLAVPSPGSKGLYSENHWIPAVGITLCLPFWAKTGPGIVKTTTVQVDCRGPLNPECGNIMGSPKGSTTVRHMCGGIMGIIVHIRKILQS
ncbi:hypothetical protein N1851_008148 [Merluccius polli]|uniref:Uncharacterized protein n=1 Tax=Merluccius polli TaxID=89951 RepID=A0AA47P4P6_MERPO|nr:hypothetical protein N1851_008148 [Merluccius polli]